MHPIPTDRVFTFADLVMLGWTRSAIRNALRTGRLIRVRHGVYSTEALCAGIEALGAAVAYPRATVSHRSALLVSELPVLGAPPPLPELTVPPRASVTMPGVRPYRATLGAIDRRSVGAAAVSSVARALVDTGRHVGLDITVVAMDAALQRQLVVPPELERVLGEQQNWPGVQRARQAFMLSDGRSESPLESLSRLAFPRLGLPAPRSQVGVYDRHGTFLGRSDFGWEDLGVVGEADGLLKYRDPDDPDALTREKIRQEAIERTGLAVARWGWDEARRHQHVLRSRILAAFERALARDRAGLPWAWVLRPSC